MIGGNPHIDEMISWAKKDKLDVRGAHITSVVQESRGISFRLNSVRVFAPVLGTHQAHNIALAITAAIGAGMSIADAIKAAEKIFPVDRMMKPIAGVNGSRFIDDTFNNNPDAAIAAIDYLAQARGKKILVFQPMIELGSFTESAHRRVGEAADKICDAIILTNKNYYDSFMSGIRNKNKVQICNPNAASKYLRSVVGPEDTVVFKGKEADKILHLLL